MEDGERPDLEGDGTVGRAPLRTSGLDGQTVCAVVGSVLASVLLARWGVFPVWLAALILVGGVVFLIGEARGEYDR